MKRTLAVLASDAILLINPRILVKRVTVRTRGPKRTHPLARPFLLTPPTTEIHLREDEIELRLLRRRREHLPCVHHEPERLIGVREAVFVRVEEESEAAVLLLDQIGVGGGLVRILDLEDFVPVRLVVDAIIRGGSEQDVDHGEDLIGAFEERLCLLS